MQACILVAAAREDEQIRAQVQIQQVQAIERQRADDLVRAVRAEYARQIACLEARADALLLRIANLQEEAEEKQLEANEEVSQVHEEFSKALDEADTYLADAQSTITSLSSAHDEHIQDLRDQLASALKESNTLCAWIRCLQKEKITLHHRIERFPGQQAHAIGRAASANADAQAPLILKLKEGGIVPERICMLIRDLVGLGLKVTQVRKVIPCVAEAISVEVQGDLSERTGGHTVKEGGYMAQMQVVEELKAADG